MLNGGIDEIFSRSDPNGRINPLADGLGSLIALGDSLGATQTDYAYGAFGQPTTTGLISNTGGSASAGIQVPA